jgi:hypothetical protein
MPTQTLYPGLNSAGTSVAVYAEDGVTLITADGISVDLVQEYVGGSFVLPAYYRQKRAQGLLMSEDPLALSGDAVSVLPVSRIAVTTVGSVSVFQGEFGARGDGTADDTAAIQAAVTAAGLVGADVFLPRGTYRLTSAIVVPSNVTVRGSGRPSLYSTGKGTTVHATSGHAFTLTNARDASIQDLAIVCDAGVGGIYAAATGTLVGTHNLTLRRLSITLPATGTCVGIELYGVAGDQTPQHFFPIIDDVDIFGQPVSATSVNLSSTGIKIHADGYQSCVGARILGGRIYQVHTGIDLDWLDTLMCVGTKLDGIAANPSAHSTSGSARGLRMREHTQYCNFFMLRVESNDVDIQIDSGSDYTLIETVVPLQSGHVVNNGNRTSIRSSSGGVTNRFASPTLFENRLIASRTLELSAQENSTLANGNNHSVADDSSIATSFIRIVGPTGAFGITGFRIAPTEDSLERRRGMMLKVYNTTSQVCTFRNENTGTSTATERIHTLTGADVAVAGPAVSEFIYDQTFNGLGIGRWIGPL